MKRLRLFFARPIVRAACLVLPIVALAALLITVNLSRIMTHSGATTIAASEAATIVKSGQARSIEVQADRAYLNTVGGEFVFIKDREASVPQMLASLGVSANEMGALTYTVGEAAAIPWAEVLPTLALTVLIGGVLLLTLRRNASGPGLGFGRSRARRFVGQAQQVTFDNVAGAAEAKQELMEIVDFLKSPEKFAAMGARIPKGVLLIGPPGTGKTLISRAVAGEAGAPFFSISGSEFVEMFVGVGASRVRDLFEQAKRQAPSIILSTRSTRSAANAALGTVAAPTMSENRPSTRSWSRWMASRATST